MTVALYGRSGLYRYAEEALAEGYATRSIVQGMQFPIAEGYVSIPRLMFEGGAVAGVGYLGYEATH